MTNNFNLKAGQSLPDDHSIVRFCPPKFVERDPDTKEILGIFPAAWKMRPVEDYLSVNWLEFFHVASEQDALTDCIAQFKTNLDVRKSSAFAVCNVNIFRSICESKGNNVKIVLMPEDDNFSHTAIKRIKSDDDDLFADISFKAIRLIVDNQSL